MVEKKKQAYQAVSYDQPEDNSRLKSSYINEKSYESGSSAKTKVRKSLSKREIVIKIIDYLIRLP